MKTNLDGAPSDYTQPYADSSYAGPFEYPLRNDAWVKNQIPAPNVSAGLPSSSILFLSRFNPFLVRLFVLLAILILSARMGGFFVYFGAVWFWFQFILIPCVKLIRRFYYDLSVADVEASGPAAAVLSLEAVA